MRNPYLGIRSYGCHIFTSRLSTLEARNYDLHMSTPCGGLARTGNRVRLSTERHGDTLGHSEDFDSWNHKL